MKPQRCQSVGFAVLTSALMLLSDNVTASSSTTTVGRGSSTAPAGCVPNFYGDGDCDLFNNIEACGFDGGDCCECTCVSTATFLCGHSGGFSCLDPSASCVDDDDVTSNPEYEDSGDGYTSTLGCVDLWKQDGICDYVNNDEACGYDGGDCCECTCISNIALTCGDDGYACVDPSAACVDDDDVTANPGYDDTTSTPETDSPSDTEGSTSLCIDDYISDGGCDPTNNREECEFDGGDCCECTCVSTPDFTCGNQLTGGFACIDPDAACVDEDDDDSAAFPEDDSYFGFDDDDDLSTSYSFACIDGLHGDGDCDSEQNTKECGYDGGDCCECTCVSTDAVTCGDENNGGFDCVDPGADCTTSYVEAGTKTTVSVSANGYDTRPGVSSGDVGCMEDGCTPELTRDGVSEDSDSRWSCSQALVSNERRCNIEFTFEEPQDIVDVHVAFWMGDERSRTLQARINKEVIGQFDSQPESTFTALGIEGAGVQSVEFRTIGLAETEWISLTEVLFLVEP